MQEASGPDALEVYSCILRQTFALTRVVHGKDSAMKIHIGSASQYIPDYAPFLFPDTGIFRPLSLLRYLHVVSINFCLLAAKG
eukprot:scaffold134745_cov34-Prasinocladus_malaysianus.AAC.1